MLFSIWNVCLCLLNFFYLFNVSKITQNSGFSWFDWKKSFYKSILICIYLSFLVLSILVRTKSQFERLWSRYEILIFVLTPPSRSFVNVWDDYAKQRKIDFGKGEREWFVIASWRTNISSISIVVLPGQKIALTTTHFLILFILFIIFLKYKWCADEK